MLVERLVDESVTMTPEEMSCSIVPRYGFNLLFSSQLALFVWYTLPSFFQQHYSIKILLVKDAGLQETRYGNICGGLIETLFCKFSFGGGRFFLDIDRPRLD